MFKNKKILIGVTGSIAAYKVATLVRLLVKSECEVKVIMTNAAQDFIPALTLATLSKNTVLTNLYDASTWANHVALGRWADVLVIAPASCNTIAKMANGICDNLLLAVYLSATCPIIIAPAMDEDMWLHPSTKKNLTTLQKYGNQILPVYNGELASGLLGMGRMAEPEVIINQLSQFFLQKNDLLGKKVLITAGPTYEHIDPVRFIGNYSTGKMGIAIATECVARGAEVHLILGPTNVPIPAGIQLTNVHTAAQMYEACIALAANYDVAILSAAVADYMPKFVSKNKIKKNNDKLTVEFTKTKDILQSLGTIKKPHQILVGFALETNNEEAYALQKLQDKNADFIVLNSLQDDGVAFGSDNNKITIFSKKNEAVHFELKSKLMVAKDIINTILN